VRDGAPEQVENHDKFCAIIDGILTASDDPEPNVVKDLKYNF